MQKISNKLINESLINSEKKKELNKKIFSQIAPKYNLATRILSFNQDKYWKKELISLLPELDKPECLDIACGTGDITFAVADKYPNASIIGLDVTQNMIEHANGLNKFRNVRFVCCDMCSTQFETSKFDLVTASYALRNAPNLQDALIEINRILKPDGILAVLDFSKFNNKILQKTQYFILKFWGNFWGLLMHGNPNIYGYIANSLDNYPSFNELNNFFIKNNFKIIKSKNYFLGSINIKILKKLT